MSEWVRNRPVLITAAAQGIGRASALAFAAAGARVYATDIDADALTRFEVVPSILVRRLDVRDEAAVRAAFAEIGPVDVLFNCAGFVHAGTVLDMTDADFDFAVDLNLRSMIRTIHAALPGRLERGEGAIINMASVVGAAKGSPNRFVYGVTKAAVIGLTKAIAADYVARGIRCNAICPDTV
jgi:2-keto-3-deoxy-L-fuconate dehydrogenase